MGKRMSNDKDNNQDLDYLIDIDMDNIDINAGNEEPTVSPDELNELPEDQMPEDESSADDNYSDDDPDLNPDRIASGAGKRLNNRALYVVFALLGTFIFCFFWVMYDKSHTPDMFGGASEKKPDNASKLAAQITSNAPNGLIMPLEKEEPAPKPQSKPEPEKEAETQPPAMFQFPVASNINTPPTREMTEEQRRIRQLKMQMFEQALFSKTSVPVEGYANQSQAQNQRSSVMGTGGFSGNYQHDDVKSQLAETRARLARMQSSGGSQDANQVYQEKLAALRASSDDGSGGGVGGFSQTSSAAGVSNVSDDRWLLQNNRAAQGLNPLETPRTPYELKAGGVIPATMISGINSDLPGQIIAQTTQPVYNTSTGRHTVIPQGTRLVGMYDSSVAYGQKRVLVVWQRLIFPDGKTLDLGSMPGTDSAGYSGFNDKVNTHFWRTMGSALLMSAVIAGVELSQNDSNSSSDGDSQRASDALSEALGQSLGQALTQIIQKNLNVSPTLEIRPGYRFNVFVTKDIPFTQPYQSFDY